MEPRQLGINRLTYMIVVLLLPTMKSRDLATALQIFRDKGGTLRTRDLVTLGVHTDALYSLRENGRIVELGRGLYRVAEAGEGEYPDLAVVAARAPSAAICLISALSYHDITTQSPPPSIWLYQEAAITASSCRYPSRCINSIRRPSTKALRHSA